MTYTTTQRYAVGELVHLAPCDLAHNNYAGRDANSNDADTRRAISELGALLSKGWNYARGTVEAYYDAFGTLTISDGHHRITAALEIGMPTVPVTIVDAPADDVALRLAQLAANSGRRNDSPLGRFYAYVQAAAAGASVEDIAAATGSRAATVVTYLALRDVDPVALPIALGRGINYATRLGHLPHDAQREATRVLETHPDWRLTAWENYLEKFTRQWNERIAADSAMFDMGALTVQTWNDELAAYVEDERETETALASIPAAPMGLAEIATYINASRQTVYAWRKRGKLPAADIVLAIGELWHVTTIDEWNATRCA